MKEISDAFGYWFSGFTDGEGCFNISKKSRWNPCTNYNCQFIIGLRDDDQAILEKIRDTLGIGTIGEKPVYPYDTRNTRPQTKFRVYAIEDCAKLVKLFEKYPLQAKKQNDFAVWKEAVVELQKPVDCRNADLLDYYFLKIKEVRKYEEQGALARPKRIELQLTIEF